jgi:hypothetical protein
MHQRAWLDVTPRLADGPAILANGVPGADTADRNLVATRNQLTDVNAVAVIDKIVRFGWPPQQTDTFARLELANGDGHIVAGINLVNGRVNGLAQCSILPRKPVSFKGSPGLLSSPW